MFQRKAKSTKHARRKGGTIQRFRTNSLQQRCVTSACGQDCASGEVLCLWTGLAWLATMREVDLGLFITLVNPFRNAVTPICLPLLDWFCFENICYPEVFFPKVIFSGDPISNNPDNNHVVIAIYDRVLKLAFIGGGQKCWSYIDLDCYLTDAIFYKTQVYAVGTGESILSVNVNSKQPKAKVVTAPQFLGESEAIKGYLVESTEGDLFHVQRILEPKPKKAVELWTESFKVYRLVFNEQDGSIVDKVEVKSIGEEALFVGNNYSMSVLASNFPGCQPNSIYFTEDLTELWEPQQLDDCRRPSDMGIFNLEDETVSQHYRSISPWERNIPPALWVVPPAPPFNRH